MLAEIILFMFLGILAGTFTGLAPGIHINLIGVSLVALSASLLSSINPLYLVVLIVAMAITHTFVDFIPSIFLGCPDTDTELSVLPGHELLKKGQGYEAVLLSAYGGLAATFLLVLITAPSFFVVQKIYGLFQNIMPYLLIAVSVTLIMLEKNKFSGFLVFFLTGVLGFSVLNLDIKEPLLPLLTGLFGSSMLVMSIKNKTVVPKQKISKPRIKGRLLSPLLGALVTSPLSGMLPGLGSGQAAILGNVISRTDRKGFLVLLGATNTIVMGFSFIALYLIKRTRTGAAVAINNLLGNFSWQVLVLILMVVLVTGIISFFWTLVLAKFFSKKIADINYTKLSLIILGCLIIVVSVFSGFFGLIVLIFSTLTGIYCISLGVKRTNMMGCLLLPTIIFYLTI